MNSTTPTSPNSRDREGADRPEQTPTPRLLQPPRPSYCVEKPLPSGRGYPAAVIQLRPSGRCHPVAAILALGRRYNPVHSCDVRPQPVVADLCDAAHNGC